MAGENNRSRDIFFIGFVQHNYVPGVGNREVKKKIEHSPLPPGEVADVGALAMYRCG